MEAFGVGSILFLVFAVVGLIVFCVGIFFLVKNIKWKKEKDLQGINATSNIIGIVVFSFVIFFGAAWLLCFGAAAAAFGVLSGSF